MRSPFFIQDKIPIFGEDKCHQTIKTYTNYVSIGPEQFSFCIFFFCCASRALHFIPQVVACPAPSEQVDVCASFRKRKRLQVNLFAEKQISKKTEQKGKSEQIHFTCIFWSYMQFKKCQVRGTQDKMQKERVALWFVFFCTCSAPVLLLLYLFALVLACCTFVCFCWHFVWASV